MSVLMLLRLVLLLMVMLLLFGQVLQDLADVDGDPDAHLAAQPNTLAAETSIRTETAAFRANVSPLANTV